MGFPLVVWAALVVMALVTRSALPVDETRYLAVAWEMWQGGDFLVPHLNGLPYSDKPPLLFWVIQAGWALFGVNEWWPRLLPALFGAASLCLTIALARALWPDRPELRRVAPRVLLGFLLWSVFNTVLMFDLLLTVCVLLADLGVIAARRGSRHAGWLIAVGLGLGVLAKGPVVFLHVLPLALTAPWWSPGGPPAGRWYGRLALAALGGVALAGLWVVPAAIVGGEEYRRLILVDQTSHRMVDSFAHQRPWWWYLPLLPAALFPFSLWPPLWRALGRLKALRAEGGFRVLGVAVVPAFVAFSLISGKQPHYLLPLLPFLALAVARLLAEGPPPQHWHLLLPVAPAVAIALALVLAPWLGETLGAPGWLQAVPLGVGVVVLVGLLLLMVGFLRRPLVAHEHLGLVSLWLVFGLLLGFSPIAHESYDLHKVAHYLEAIQHQGTAVAFVGKYQGELHFFGRLRAPIQQIANGEVAGWLAAHPTGVVLEPTHHLLSSNELRGAVLVMPYRGKQMVVWAADDTMRPPAEGGARFEEARSQ